MGRCFQDGGLAGTDRPLGSALPRWWWGKPSPALVSRLANANLMGVAPRQVLSGGRAPDSNWAWRLNSNVGPLGTSTPGPFRAYARLGLDGDASGSRGLTSLALPGASVLMTDAGIRVLPWMESGELLLVAVSSTATALLWASW